MCKSCLSHLSCDVSQGLSVSLRRISSWLGQMVFLAQKGGCPLETRCFQVVEGVWFRRL